MGGEVLGIGGLMGAGRTELLMHLFGAYGERESGEVMLDGKPLVNHTPGEAIQRGMVLISEDRKRYGLFLEQHIGFNLSIASLRAFMRQFLIDRNSEIVQNQTFFDTLAIKAPGLEDGCRQPFRR